tara:strand:- start:39 stop:662 length:624 start_codon:yes stop_codon:yes gene_type:complete
MNLDNYYYYFKEALRPKLCDDIIKYALEKKEKFAVTSGYEDKKLSKKDIKDIKKIRDSNVVWLNDLWIYKELHPFVQEANQKSGWNFEWDSSEICQFTKYKNNQFYDWHCDSWKKPYNDPGNIRHGKVRKLSMTCQLTDSSEYKGGELEFDFRNDNPNKKRNTYKCTEILSKGSIIIFPSFVWHRVKPVRSGTRYSLVVWHLGKPFK